MTHDLKFGWLSPVIGNAGSDHQAIVLYQQEHILPTALPLFDSLWIADHFYGFDARTDPFLEAWTTLTWLGAKFPDVTLCHHVLGHGYRPPALTAKMAATLQTLTGGRFVLGIGAGWRADEYAAYGYDFPKPSVRFAQLEELIQICRLMWTEDHPSFEGVHYSITDASAPPLPEPYRGSVLAPSAPRSACRSSDVRPTSGTASSLVMTTGVCGSASSVSPLRRRAGSSVDRGWYDDRASIADDRCRKRGAPRAPRPFA